MPNIVLTSAFLPKSLMPNINKIPFKTIVVKDNGILKRCFKTVAMLPIPPVENLWGTRKTLSPIANKNAPKIIKKYCFNFKNILSPLFSINKKSTENSVLINFNCNSSYR